MQVEEFTHHLKKLAKTNSDQKVEIRKLRAEVETLRGDIDHYRQEFARQNARIITMSILKEVADGTVDASPSVAGSEES